MNTNSVSPFALEKLQEGKIYSFHVSNANRHGGVIYPNLSDFMDQHHTGHIRQGDQFILTGKSVLLQFGHSESRFSGFDITFVYTPIALTNKLLFGWLVQRADEWNEFWPVEVSESSPTDP